MTDKEIKEKVADTWNGFVCGILPHFDGCGDCEGLSPDGKRCLLSERIAEEIHTLYLSYFNEIVEGLREIEGVCNYTSLDHLIDEVQLKSCQEEIREKLK